MSSSASKTEPTPSTLSEKQSRILAYLRQHVAEQTYFKSRLIADDLDLSPKEVGSNMAAVRQAATGIQIEKWGYSTGTTWKITA
ncbi:DUF7123 family protein [Haloarcula nitratireducens]|uniref:DUF7123 family protein n=1 Tax=Haloarcula nitratireducens TaxID=2487749 RepID=UPI001F384EB6|nr:hypothetical protein [Halomicroarcula nitratireducens]